MLTDGEIFSRFQAGAIEAAGRYYGRPIHGTWAQAQAELTKLALQYGLIDATPALRPDQMGRMRIAILSVDPSRSFIAL